MKKLKDLTVAELKQLCQKNNDFATAVADEAYDNNMFWQGEWYNEMLGKKTRGYEYNDHYTSFYLRLTDAEKFMADLPESCKDYLAVEHLPLYDVAKKSYAEWCELSYDEQLEYDERYEKLENAAKELLEAIESELHEFENITDEDVDGVLENIVGGVGGMAEWELDDNGVIIETIHKLYK